MIPKLQLWPAPPTDATPECLPASSRRSEPRGDEVYGASSWCREESDPLSWPEPDPAAAVGSLPSTATSSDGLAGKSRSLRDYIKQIGSESYVKSVSGRRGYTNIAAHGAKQSRSCGDLSARSCDSGLTCRFSVMSSRIIDPTVAEQFAWVLQELLLECLTAPDSLGVRLFDEYTNTRKLVGGMSITFTQCKCDLFRRLRSAACLAEETYRKSLCSRPFVIDHGHAASRHPGLFFTTHDGMFVVKAVNEQEFGVLGDIVPAYLAHLEENPDSLLCRFYGAYILRLDDHILRFVVMANVLPYPSIRIYDLKGTTEDRWVDPELHRVLRDLNFINNSIYLEAQRCQQLLGAIREDVYFLESVGLMDYSLLLGIASMEDIEHSAATARNACTANLERGWLGVGGEPCSETVFQLGIVDFLQRWTPKKIAAHWLKKPTLGCCHEINSEPPMFYCTRFFKYVAALVVPVGSPRLPPSGRSFAEVAAARDAATSVMKRVQALNAEAKEAQIPQS
mmetsp:Transcript_77161/g.152958  ORF Transcript_77161/g.152958 Transcript_77161/m.152958 type:complete len:508 (-) Transcript_77161:38-1561(-)